MQNSVQHQVQNHVQNPYAAFDAALASFSAGQWQAAADQCHALVNSWPQYASAHQLYSIVLARLGQLTLSDAHMRLAVQLQPDDPQFRYNHAVNLHEAGDTLASAMQYRACLALNPDHTDALWNYGEMLRLDEHFELARDCFERLLRVLAQTQPDVDADARYPGVYHRLGVCMGSLGQVEAAYALFERASQSRHMPPEQRALSSWEHALLALSHGDFERGWPLYLRRFDAKGLNKVYCHDFGLPWWAGDVAALAGKTLVLHGEQGLGDELMFASLVPRLLADLAAQGGKLVLAVKPGLVRLFTHSFAGLGAPITVVPHEVGKAPADLGKVMVVGAVAGAGVAAGVGVGLDWGAALQCAIGSLPAFYQATDRNLPKQAYLHAPADRVEYYQNRINKFRPEAANQLKVGLMWGSAPNSGLPRHAQWALQRSIDPHWLIPLSQVQGVCFVSLQNQERGAEAALMPELNVLDLSDEQTDFLETAALIANLDVVISVDTSVAHLAGGMGATTWQPLMRRADWRHLHSGDRSYWYADVRYFRQQRAKDWVPVVEALHQQLQAAAEAKSKAKTTKTSTGAARQGLDAVKAGG